MLMVEKCGRLSNIQFGVGEGYKWTIDTLDLLFLPNRASYASEQFKMELNPRFLWHPKGRLGLGCLTA